MLPFNIYEIILIVLIAGYNIVLFSYAIKEGLKSLSSKKTISHKFISNCKNHCKYSVVYNTTTELYSIYDGHMWHNELEIELLESIMQAKKESKY